MSTPDPADVFLPDGPLSRAFPNYQSRPSQVELAKAVFDAIYARDTLVAEAGTGTGKTWAYLVPAFLADAKVLISTGTRTLQDQLFHRDIPALQKALEMPLKVSLLKGRSNYVCHYYLDRIQQEEHGLKSRAEIPQLRAIEQFAQRSRSGDKTELAEVPESADIWNRVTSTRENCLGQECPFVKDCFVIKARRQAQDADVVVINHALYMADLALRAEGVSELLPDVDVVVFDEAHQVPDTATRFLGDSVSSFQLIEAGRQAQVAGRAHAAGATEWDTLVRSLETATRELRLQAAGIEKMPGRRATHDRLPNAKAIDEALAGLVDSINALTEALMAVSEAHPELDAALQTLSGLQRRLLAWAQPDADVATESIRWAELTTHHIRLHRAPLQVAPVFTSQRPDDQAWVFTSATLSLNGDFSHFQQQLGLEDATSLSWESPFDYERQGLLYVPDSLPLPSHPQFTDAFVETLFPLVRDTEGGVMVLCTTLRAVDRITKLLTERLAAKGVSRPVLQQGSQSRGALLDQFRQAGHAILVGSASFWEGVDVPGQALALLAIDKLPFAPPDDPVLEARLNLCRQQGGNPFMMHQLPAAAIALKQGAGRLIRSETDTGVLMVGDTRLVDKPYGRLLWRGLPPFARTREARTALAFVAQNSAQVNA